MAVTRETQNHERSIMEPLGPTDDACPILMFHMLDEPRSALAFPPRLFREGLRRLADCGYHTLDLVEAAALVRAGNGFPAKSIVLTFDDGFASVHDEALPLLVDLGWTATMFVSTGTIGRRSTNSWPVVDAAALRELRNAGVSIGGHTVSHPDLTRSTDAEVVFELTEGKRQLEDLLGEEVRSFAYPFGRYDTRSRALAAKLFDCACSDVLDYARSESDPWLLPRIETWYLSRSWVFERFGSPSVDAYLAFRRVPRALRRAVAERTR